MDSVRDVITFDEVAKHKEREDIWILISGKVYDVTKFMEEHPGGDEVLLAVTGTGMDATDDFIDTGHSNEAKEMMQKYYIADIDPSSIPLKKKIQRRQLVSMVAHDKHEDSRFAVKVLQLGGPLLILGLAFGYQFSGKIENVGRYWAFIKSFVDNIF